MRISVPGTSWEMIERTASARYGAALKHGMTTEMSGVGAIRQVLENTCAGHCRHYRLKSHGSRPCLPSLALNSNDPFTFVRLAGEELALRGPCRRRCRCRRFQT